jgi:hypothetical protein
MTPPEGTAVSEPTSKKRKAGEPKPVLPRNSVRPPLSTEAGPLAEADSLYRFDRSLTSSLHLRRC